MQKQRKLGNLCMPWGLSQLESNADIVPELTRTRRMTMEATVLETLVFNNMDLAILHVNLSLSYLSSHPLRLQLLSNTECPVLNLDPVCTALDLDLVILQ